VSEFHSKGEKEAFKAEIAYTGPGGSIDADSIKSVNKLKSVASRHIEILQAGGAATSV